MTSKRRPARTGQRRQTLQPHEVSITREAAYIVAKAQARYGRVISLGDLVLFSTESGDAWLLDPADGHALCLARDGLPQPYSIMETSSRFQIEWTATYQIEGPAFVVADRSGSGRTILGYPADEILSACLSPEG